MSLLIFWPTQPSLTCYCLSSPDMKVTTQSAEGAAHAVTHLAVISPLNCSLIGPLQRLITLTNGLLPTARLQRYGSLRITRSSLATGRHIETQEHLAIVYKKYYK